MKKARIVLLITVFMVALFFVGKAYGAVNNSTVYKVEIYAVPNTAGVIGALYTTTLNNLQVITKHCVTTNTKIYLNDKPAKLSELKRGYKVIVTFITDNCKTATIIKAYK